MIIGIGKRLTGIGLIALFCMLFCVISSVQVTAISNVTVNNVNTNTDDVVIYKDYVLKPDIDNPDNDTLTYKWNITDEDGNKLASEVNQTNGYATFKPLSSNVHTGILSIFVNSSEVATSKIYFTPLTQTIDIKLIFDEGDVEEEIAIPQGSSRTAYLFITNIGTDNYFDISIRYWLEQDGKRMGKISTTEDGLSLQHKIPITIEPRRMWDKGTYFLMITVVTDNGVVHGISKQIDVVSPVRSVEEIDTAKKLVVKKIGTGMFVSIIVASVGYVYIKTTQMEEPKKIFTVETWKKVLVIGVISFVLIYLLL